jgi:hypothetical protein
MKSADKTIPHIETTVESIAPLTPPDDAEESDPLVRDILKIDAELVRLRALEQRHARAAIEGVQTQQKPKRPSYLLRDLDPVLWKQFQNRAGNELRPAKAVILRLIELYIRHGLEAIELVLGEQRDVIP